MYETIYVPVDNSEYSNQAVEKAVKIGGAFGSKMVGSHVYAAKMHDYRFKQMEYTLPSEYLQETEIERQRKIHDSLITLGLELISDCYLNAMNERCKASGLALERKMMDGKHHVEIVKDIQESSYDLVVLGVLGMGKTKDSQIGSVCERVVRYSTRDVLVIKHVEKEEQSPGDTILVGIDGSPQSFGGLVTAIELARKFGKKIELISVYDPYLHYAVFNSIVDVLTKEASKVFRFEEQNQLHEEIIDTGLAQIYQSHLNIGETMARQRGVEVSKTLLDGKAFQKVLNHARKINPWLLVIGRIGVHSSPGETGLGSNAENLLRLSPCDILLSTTLEYPELDRRAEESILWTEEAETKMKRVPDMVRGIARTAILRLAIEQGHSVITASVIQDAMDRFMPKKTAQATEKLAEALAFEKVRLGNVSMCKKCGLVASNSNPVTCGVCGSKEFETISNELLQKLGDLEGGLEDEITYDGKSLRWSKEAKVELNAIEDKYQKRRAKARIEKSARTKKLEIVTFEFARQVIDDEIGRERPMDWKKPEASTEALPLDGVKELVSYNGDNDKKIIGSDEKGIQLRSVFSWSEEATARMLRVPSGFMRDKTQERVENLALEAKAEVVDIGLVEAGLEIGRKMMEEFVQQNGLMDAAPKKEAGKCPFSSLVDTGPNGPGKEAFQGVLQTYNQEAKTNGGDHTKVNGNNAENKTVSHVYTGAVEPVLNEAGLMLEMHKKREEIKVQE